MFDQTSTLNQINAGLKVRQILPQLAEAANDVTATTDRIMALPSFDLENAIEVYETVDAVWQIAKDIIPEEDLKAITRPILREVGAKRFL